MNGSSEFHLPEAVALLTRTPAALDALLRGLPAPWPFGNEGNGTWSPCDVLGHLVHGEQTDWMPRIRMLLDCGEARAFDPFDRFAQIEAGRERSIEQLLDEFASLRAANLATLEGLHLLPQDLARRGTHPAFGTVTLSQLLATWAVHDLTHLHQLSRVMAHRYREAVGPWSAYLGVLKCTTRGAS